MRSRMLGAGLAAVAALSAAACDLPVNEYALQNWERNPYQVYYFYRGKPDGRDAEVNEYLTKVARREIGNANLVFAPVDVRTLGDKATPEIYRQAWEQAAVGERELPVHVLLTPRGSVLFRGRLDVGRVKRLMDSPKRREMAELLCSGANGLLVLLKSGDEAADEAAAETVKKIIAEAADEGLKVGFVEVDRDDEQEKGLVEQLLAVEEDLAEIGDPMVFAVFGRGHALEPCIGKGITAEAVAEMVAFMNGPCTCEVKMWNPGMDLLTSFDWEARVLGPDHVIGAVPPAAEEEQGAGEREGMSVARVAGLTVAASAVAAALISGVLISRARRSG